MSYRNPLFEWSDDDDHWDVEVPCAHSGRPVNVVAYRRNGRLLYLLAHDCEWDGDGCEASESADPLATFDALVEAFGSGKDELLTPLQREHWSNFAACVDEYRCCGRLEGRSPIETSARRLGIEHSRGHRDHLVGAVMKLLGVSRAEATEILRRINLAAGGNRQRRRRAAL